LYSNFAFPNYVWCINDYGILHVVIIESVSQYSTFFNQGSSLLDAIILNKVVLEIEDI